MGHRRAPWGPSDCFDSLNTLDTLDCFDSLGDVLLAFPTQANGGLEWGTVELSVGLETWGCFQQSKKNLEPQRALRTAAECAESRDSMDGRAIFFITFLYCFQGAKERSH